ncbi:MAG: DUF3604 domain-containing protein [Acidobacteriota bacterium]|nr:DUF3604 domain-containing protein [Acidobacteriota bacterium]
MRLSSRAIATRAFTLFGALGIVVACGGGPPDGGTQFETTATPDGRAAADPLRRAFFGDLHVHTRHSLDAYIFQVRASPDDAYRYAKGDAIDHPSGHQIRLESGPLDFLSVTDHGFFLGTLPAMDDPEDPLYQTELAAEIRALENRAFSRTLAAFRDGELAALDTEPAKLAAWNDFVAAAENHNDPGRFTTFVGYEYTSSAPDRGNLHRNVIFRNSDVPDRPFARTDSLDPEDLWRWLDELRGQGIEGLAIPHNSNGSNGHMFQLETVDGEALDIAYAELRMRNEPIVEITQVKGTSESHPLLFPDDEWADFEIFPYRIATQLYSEPKGSYVREAFLNGMVMEEAQGFNPFRFGVIGSTDTHNAGPTPEEDNYHSKVGFNDGTPQRRGSVPLDTPGPDGNLYSPGSFHFFGASGLAGVWAEENTRESLYDAMRRKETFATTGPRLRVRLFAGYDYGEDLAGDADMVEKAYSGGVPMGGDLPADGDREPRFLIWAARDARSAPLQRVQIVKGWVENGKAHDRIYDAVCSDGLEPDPQTGLCPDNGATVDLSDCSISSGVGAAELGAVWTDPDFEPSLRTFYYVRVLENPVCRWSTWDAIRSGVAPREDLPTTIQERAFTSPIWYVPRGS